MAGSIEIPASGPKAVDAEAMIASAYCNPKALSHQFRVKRFDRIKAMIDRICAEKGACRIIDIGGTRYYWDIAAEFVATRPIEITIINREESPHQDGKFIHRMGDAVALDDYDDQSFDLVHSNSVIEHVGDWANMKAMAANISRLAPAYYAQSPNFWFPYEPHFRCAFIHWLPEQLRYRLVKRFALGFAGAKENADAAMDRVQSVRLVDRGQMAALFPDAKLAPERFCGMAKSWIATRE